MKKSSSSPSAFNSLCSPKGLWAFCFLVLVEIAFLLHIMTLNGFLKVDPGALERPDSYSAARSANYMPQFSHYALPDQYALLADSLLAGRPWLDVPTAPELAALEDPYNTQDRISIASETVPVFWDVAYFEGRYYSYFGVVPAVLLYAPFQLITGCMLPTPWAIAFLAAMALCAINACLWRAGKRWFGKTATVAWLSGCSLLTMLACNFMYLVFVARFYSVPILCSFVLTFLALWFWIDAKRNLKPALADQARPVAEAWPGSTGSKTYLSSASIAAGSFLMGLNLGCRPQMLAAALLAFPIFWNEIFVDRRLFSRSGLWPTAAGLLPFFVVAAAILAYNMVRFGAPLNFGSAYNLTGFDMQEYRQSGRITAMLGLLYLFGPLCFSGSFPFIRPEDNQWLWEIEWAPNEPFFGGFFLIKPVVTFAIILFLWLLAKNTKSIAGPAKVAGILGLLMPIVVILFDVRAAGLTERYFSDFGYWYATVACLGLLTTKAAVATGKTIRVVGIVTAVLLVVSFGLNYAVLWSPFHYDSVEFLNPQLWNTIFTLGNG